MRRHLTFLVLTLAIAAVSMRSLTNGTAGQVAQKKEAKNEAATAFLKTQLQAAPKAYRAALGNLAVERVQGFVVFKGNRSDARPELVYTWSVRWLRAQQALGETKNDKITAYQDHRERMKELREYVDKIMAEGGKFSPFPESEAAATAWYLAEAELWLLNEREK